jgi:hypothetical protein
LRTATGIPRHPIVAASQPINRHVWLSLALNTPALRLKVRSPNGPVIGDPPEGEVDQPAFTLLGQFGRPILSWRDGAVIVKHADDDYIPDLLAVARLLGARLLDTEGRELS